MEMQIAAHAHGDEVMKRLIEQIRIDEARVIKSQEGVEQALLTSLDLQRRASELAKRDRRRRCAQWSLSLISAALSVAAVALAATSVARVFS